MCEEGGGGGGGVCKCGVSVMVEGAQVPRSFLYVCGSMVRRVTCTA